MRSGTTSQRSHPVHDDPIASLFVALMGYAIGSLLVAAVPPTSPSKVSSWVLLAVTVVAACLLAARRRHIELLKRMLLSAVGLAGVVVGVGYSLYMGFERPAWLLGAGALYCYGAAVIGIASLYAAHLPDVNASSAT